MGGPRTPLFLIPAVEPDSSKPKPARGRKPSKAPPHKKESRRGMGVFQLEQLRMAREAETIRNSETDPFNHLEPMMLGLDQNLNQPSLGPFWINPYVFGGQDMRVRVSSSASVFQTSTTELSSLPNIVQQTPSEFCCCCKKKKKFVNGEECKVYNVKKEHFSEMSMTISGSDFEGLNLQNNFQFYDQKKGGLNSRAARSALYYNNNLAGGAEVVAVHRKMNPKTGKNVFMEYEFFPDGKNGTVSKEITRFQNPNTADGVGKAPSCLTPFDYSAPNSVDLSLKLSF